MRSEAGVIGKSIIEGLQRVWNRVGDGLLAAGCCLLSLILYLQTLAPSVAALFDDSLEFPLVAHRLAIAHPTGYPLYTLLARLFASGPWQNVAWGVNLLSAVSAALAVGLVYLIARRLARRLSAVIGALALAVSPVFWSQSVVAEVYTLNAAFVALLLWVALRWSERPLLPVRPFALLFATLQKREQFLPKEPIWMRLPQGARRAAVWMREGYRNLFPRVPPSRRLRPHPLLYGLVALYGLALTHHRTIFLLAPALLIYVLLVEKRVLQRPALLGPEYPNRRRWRQIAGRPIVILAACLLVPLLLYLYLPIRGHVGSLDGTYENTWSGFWRWVTASGYNVFFGENPLARDLDFAFYGELFWQQFGPVGLALAMLGLGGLLRQPRAEGGKAPGDRHGLRGFALTGLAFVTYAAFALLYRVPDVEVFFIPAFLLVAVWIAVGLDYAGDLMRPRGPRLAWRRLLSVTGLVVLLAAVAQPLFLVIRNYPDLDLSRRWIVRDYGQYVLDQELPYTNSTVIGLLGEMTLLRYFQETTGGRPDVETVVADEEAARREAVNAALDGGRSVYITRALPGIADEFALDAEIGLIDVLGELETLIRVAEPSDEVPDVPRSVDEEPIPGLQLLGYGVREHRGHWQAWARLRLWWRAPAGLDQAYKISARLLDARGRVVTATDAEPVAGVYPTTAWRPGEVVADAYEIPLPAGLPPGDYTPLVVVYDPADGSERGRVLLAPVFLQGNPARPPRRDLQANLTSTVYGRFGDLELLGFTPPDPSTAYKPGQSLPLTLLWQASGQPRDDLRVECRLEGAADFMIGVEAVGGDFSASRWNEGQTVRQWPVLVVPDGIPQGTYRLKMRLTRDRQPVPWGRGLLPLGSDLDLGPVVVGAPNPG
jgi:hypothetical protein